MPLATLRHRLPHPPRSAELLARTLITRFPRTYALLRDGFFQLRDAGIVIVLYVGLFFLVLHPSAWLPEEAYFRPFIALQSVLGKPLQLLLLLLPAVLFPRRSAFFDAPERRLLNAFLLALCAALAWQFTLYEYNYYYGMLHFWDRLLLLALLPLVRKHPFFLALFVWHVSHVFHQFAHPFPISFTDKELPVKALLLCLAFFYARIAFTKLTFSFLLYLLLCLVGSHYAWALLYKLGIEWYSIDHISHLFIATYQSGWLGFLSPEAAVVIARGLHTINPLLLIATIVIEFGAFLLFVQKRLSAWALSGFVFFHLVVLVFSGIFFWLWIVLDLALVFVIRALHGRSAPRLFGLVPTLCAWLIFAGAPWYFLPPKLAWYDTRISAGYEVIAHMEDGTSAPINSNALAPYDILFNQGKFSYLQTIPVIVSTYGSTVNPDIAQALRHPRAEEDILAHIAGIRARYGRMAFDEKKAERFADFLRRYFQNVNADPAWRARIPFSPPHHFQVATRPQEYAFDLPVTSLSVRAWRIYFTGEAFVPIQDAIILEIPIEAE